MILSQSSAQQIVEEIGKLVKQNINLVFIRLPPGPIAAANALAPILVPIALMALAGCGTVRNY